MIEKKVDCVKMQRDIRKDIENQHKDESMQEMVKKIKEKVAGNDIWKRFSKKETIIR